MKVFVTTMIAVATAGSAFAQGTVNFANRIGSAATTSMLSPVYGPNPASPFRTQQGNATTNLVPGTVDYTGHPLLFGTGFTAALFAGPVGTAPDAMQLAASSPFRTSVTLGGIWNALPGGAAAVLPNVAPNLNAIAQVRAWDNLGGTLTTWAQVLAAAPSVARGVSAPFTIFGVGDPNDGTKPPANLMVVDSTNPNFRQGMTSFSIAPVPEPGIIALGVLGLGALLLRRRK